MNEEASNVLQRCLDDHVNYLKRRQEIEQEYVGALSRLAHIEPPPLDDGRITIPPSWSNVSTMMRAQTKEEAHAHAVHLEGLSKLLFQLSSLRDDKNRMRRRIQDDLRTAHDDYQKYHDVLQRLRKTYERKCDDLRQHEEAEAHREQQEERATTVSNSFPPEHWSGSESSTGGGPSGRERKGSTASSRGGGEKEPDSPPTPLVSPPLAHPVFVSGASSSSGPPTSGYRDPPTGKPNVFEAISKRDWSGEKHRINSLARAVGDLAKRDGASHGSNKRDPSRGVKARQTAGRLKREAEQADRDYRNAVFHLGTLGLQRTRIQTAGLQSLRETCSELSAQVKKIGEFQVSSLRTMGQGTIKISDASRGSIELINPASDAAEFSRNFRTPTPEPPVYYVNAFVGECRSLLFGVSLTDYHSTHPNTLVPTIVARCINTVETSGLELEGIYRVSGKVSSVQHLVHHIERDEDSFELPRDDPATVAGVLKLYLRQLPTPLFPFPTADRLQFSADFLKDFAPSIAALTRRIRRLPPPNQATLKTLAEHLSKVVEHEQTTRMTASNLSMVFGPVVFGEDEAVTLESAQNTKKDLVMELLITQHSTLFEGLPAPLKALSRQTSISAPAGAPQDPAALSQPFPRPLDSPELLIISAPPQPSGLPAPVLPPRSSAMAPDPSRDSVYQLYQDSATAFLPSPVISSQPLQPTHSKQRSGSGEHTLSTPPPPLSAAEGRRVSPQEASAEWTSSLLSPHPLQSN